MSSTDGNSEDLAHGGSDEEAAWLDLVGRLDAADYPGDAPAPWPESEDLPSAPSSGASTRVGGPGRGTGSGGSGEGGVGGDAGSSPAAEDTVGDEGEPRAARAGHGLTSAAGTGGLTPPAPPIGGIIPVLPPGKGPFPAPGGGPDADPLQEEHFVPPPPPPLPRLSPVQKGAWLALFGGPGYLLAATLANWSVPGWLAIGAIAAFVGGFMMLVLNLGDDRDRDNDSDPGDGAVV